jgi:cobalamin biosynthesis protein CobD/CbiB
MLTTLMWMSLLLAFTTTGIMILLIAIFGILLMGILRQSISVTTTIAGEMLLHLGLTSMGQSEQGGSTQIATLVPMVQRETHTEPHTTMSGRSAIILMVLVVLLLLILTIGTMDSTGTLPTTIGILIVPIKMFHHTQLMGITGIP